MKIKKLQNILKNKTHYQRILLNSIDNFNDKLLNSDNLVSKVRIEAGTDLSDFNIAKGQKNLLVKSLTKNRNKVLKGPEIVKFISMIADTKKSSSLNEFISTIGLSETKLRNEIHYVSITYKDLLFNFKRLNFFKVNLNALSNIDFKIIINKKYKLWFANEIYSSKR